MAKTAAARSKTMKTGNKTKNKAKKPAARPAKRPGDVLGVSNAPITGTASRAGRGGRVKGIELPRSRRTTTLKPARVRG